MATKQELPVPFLAMTPLAAARAMLAAVDAAAADLRRAIAHCAVADRHARHTDMASFLAMHDHDMSARGRIADAAAACRKARETYLAHVGG